MINNPTTESALLSFALSRAGLSRLGSTGHMFSGAHSGPKQQLSEITRPMMPPLNKKMPKSMNNANKIVLFLITSIL